MIEVGGPVPAGGSDVGVEGVEARLSRLSGMRLRGLVRKEFIEIRRDRRTLALIVLVPVMLMVIFGYAATLDMRHLSTELVGRDSLAVRAAVGAQPAFSLRSGYAPDDAAARRDIQSGKVAVAIEIGSDGRPSRVLIDGSSVLIASTAERHLSALQATSTGAAATTVEVLYNPSLRSANFMVPGLIGQIMVQVALVLTALGIVRERERGTLEQLMMTPLSKGELMIGKTLPYLLIAFVDLTFALAIGWAVFGVPVRGSLGLLFAEAALFLTATLGMGLLISTVAQTQMQAMQMSVFIQLPQMLLSGLVFPVVSMPWGVRWLSYLFPLTYFVTISRGIMLKAAGVGELSTETAVLAVMAVLFVGLAAVRFRKTLD
jgi:ABC-2 type transport system permease protein